MPIRLAAFDLDGTVYQRSGKHVTDELNSIFARLNAMGIKLVASTGRHHCEYAPWVKDVELLSSPAIICSGAAIYDYGADRSVKKLEFDSKKMADAARIFDRYDRPYMSFTEFDFIYNTQSDMTDKVLRCIDLCPPQKKVTITLDKNAADIIERTKGIVKQSVLLDGTEPESFYEELGAIEGISFLRMGSPIMEIGEKKINKGAALKDLCSQMGIDMSDVVAFGDGETDMPMFEVAGLSVAMGNATDKVKSHADMVTDRFDSGGVEKALKKIFDL